MITLYHFWESGNSREVRIVLAEKGLAFESKVLNVMKGETRTPDFLAMNPFGKVPVLVDGDLTLYESNIINAYLDEHYPEPPLMPRDAPARARIRQLIYWANQHIHANLGPVLVESLLKPEDQRDGEMIGRRKAAIEAAIAEIDKRFGTGPFIMGEFSLADAALAPHVTVLDLIGIETSERFPRFSGWIERLKARPSYAGSVGPQG